MSGWVKLHRSMLEWEWYDDINVMRLFVHCLLRANHKDKQWRGIDIKRGQFYTSLDTLSEETGLTAMQLRTCFSKLKVTGEVTSSGMSRGRMVTVVKYEAYQDDNRLNDSLSTGLQQGSNRVATTNNNDKNDKNQDKDIAKAKRFSPNVSMWEEWGWPYEPDETVFNSWLSSRKKIKAGISELSFKRLGTEFCKASNLNDCLAEMELRSWKGFKSDWMQNTRGNGNGQNQQNSGSMSAVDKVRAATGLNEQGQYSDAKAEFDDGSLVASYDRDLRS